MKQQFLPSIDFSNLYIKGAVIDQTQNTVFIDINFKRFLQIPLIKRDIKKNEYFLIQQLEGNYGESFLEFKQNVSLNFYNYPKKYFFKKAKQIKFKNVINEKNLLFNFNKLKS
jgi:RNase P/RNase MRP subunit p29